MSTNTVAINGVVYAVGLWWQTLGNAKTAQEEARRLVSDLAEQSDGAAAYNCFALRRDDGAVQAGYGLCADAMRPHPSLAAALASAKPGSWVGRFVLSEGVLVLAVSDGVILPDGDVFSEASGAEGAFSNLQHLVDDGEVFDFGEGEAEDYIADLLAQVPSRRVPRLQPLSPKPPIITLIALALVLVAVFGGYSYWKSWKEADELRQLEAAEHALNSQIAPKRQQPVYASPWREGPDPGALLSKCRAAMASMPVIQAGWRMHAMQCNKDAVKVTWQRRGGRFLGLPTGAVFVAQAPDNPVSTFNHAGDVIKVSSDRGIVSVQETLPHLYEVARKWGKSITVSKDSPIPVVDAAGLTAVEVLAMSPGMQFQWKVVFRFMPSADVLLALAKVPGITVDAFEWVNGGWEISGVVYAKST